MLDLPDVQSAPVLEPLAEAYNALVNGLERRVEGFHSSMSLYYETLHGLLLMSGQSFGAAMTLVKDEAGDRIYPAQSEILGRSILEGFGVVLTLRESPERRARLYALDLLRNVRTNCAEMTFALAGVRWVAWAQREWQGIQEWKERLMVTPDEWAKLPSWPSPGQLTRPETKGGTPYLTGSAAEVWELLYFVWYGDMSTAVHQKGRALLTAVRRHRLRGEERRALRNNAVIAATLAHACTLTEVCASGPMASPPRKQLLVAWKNLRPWADVAERVYQMRFGDLLDNL